MEMTEFRLRFKGLRAGWKALETARKSQELVESPRFNLFRVLGIHSREVKTHSAFLANLLDPDASHGQGDLFLRAFLKGCVPQSRFLPEVFATLPTDNWQTFCETAVEAVRYRGEDGETASEGEDGTPSSTAPSEPGLDDVGRLDILIRHPSSGSIIVVENKIYAKDQKEQLKRYRSWLHSSRHACPMQALLYLTLDGKDPSEDSRPTSCVGPADPYEPGKPSFACMSYRKHIVPILSECLRSVRSPLVATVLKQYIAMIQTL